jgi:hypothetical protein
MSLKFTLKGKFQSRTFFHGLNQSSSLAAVAQKASGFLRAEFKTLPLFPDKKAGRARGSHGRLQLE